MIFVEAVDALAFLPQTFEELLADYPYLEREDILQALRYAAWLTEEREIQLTTA